ncbi:MAG TPA: hypothetical protein VGD91_18280, partial [Trebonia sp.]
MGSRAATIRALTGNRPLLRLVAAYALFTLTEYAVWIAMLVYAYAWGGAATAGLAALAQLAPAALLAPVLPALAAAGIAAALPPLALGGAVIGSTAVTATRPAQSTLLPSLAATPDLLTAANVIVSWVEAAGIAAAGSLTGLLIWL